MRSNKQEMKSNGKKNRLARNNVPAGSRAPTDGGRSLTSVLLRQVPLFPIVKTIPGQLYYEQNLFVNYALGAIGTYVFTANGVYDPNVTSTGHQPMGFDQMMALYEQATVIRSRIKVTFTSPSVGLYQRVAIFLAPDTTAITAERLVENGLATMGVVGGGGATDNALNYVTLELACDIPVYFGRTREAVLADPQMYCTTAANPGEQVYFHIVAWNPFSAAAGSVGFDAVLSYDVVYWEPRKLNTS